jgi:three-Cys-motif partner protein
MVREAIWELDQHTKAKHDILKRYLQAWFPILSKYNSKIVYIDGFAGPGEYKGGKIGSPIIAINAAKDHIISLKSEIIFWFIEEDNTRCAHLRNILENIETPPNFKIHVDCGAFDERLSVNLDNIEKQGAKLAPTFAFIDPFGFSDTPFSVVEKIMKNEKCEVFINIMSGFLNRFKNQDYNKAHIDNLFGTEDWIEVLSKASNEEEVVEYYQERLLTIAKYVRSFAMKNNTNQIIYRLIFATNSYDGLKKMKEAMWKIDETGSFTYSDTTDPLQTFLYPKEPNYNHLKHLLVLKYNGKIVLVEDIEKFVVIETPYRETHFKIPLFVPMEKANEIEIIESPRKRKFSYPNGTRIMFKSQSSEIEISDEGEKCENKQVSLFDFDY